MGNQHTLGVCYLKSKAICYNTLGKLQIEFGEYENARQNFREALRLRPRDEEYKTNCGKALLLIGNDENAEKLFHEILQQNDDDSRANYYQGVVMMKKDDYDAALIFFEKCLRLRHHRIAEVYMKKGLVLLIRGELDDALECFKSVLESNSKNIRAHNYIGCIHNAREENEEALQCHIRCLELDPNYVITCNRGQKLSSLKSVSGEKELINMVDWFQNQNLHLSEKQALQYSLILFKNGVYSVNIMNICRRTKFLKQKDYKKMKLPEGVVGFLLNSPTETVDDYSTVDQLYDWLSDALGVKCRILLQKIYDILMGPELQYTLPLLRLNSHLTSEKLQGHLLGKYVTHSIIQYLKYEKWNKLTTQLLPKISINQFQGLSDAEFKQLLFGLFLKLDDQWVNLLFYATQHPQLIEVIKDKIMKFFGNGAPESKVEELFWQLLDKKLNAHTETLQSTLEEFLCYLKYYLDSTANNNQFGP